MPVAADLLNRESLERALASISPTHVFITSWMRNETEAENIRVNSLMVRNLLPMTCHSTNGTARGGVQG